MTPTPAQGPVVAAGETLISFCADSKGPAQNCALVIPPMTKIKC